MNELDSVLKARDEYVKTHGWISYGKFEIIYYREKAEREKNAKTAKRTAAGGARTIRAAKTAKLRELERASWLEAVDKVGVMEDREIISECLERNIPVATKMKRTNSADILQPKLIRAVAAEILDRKLKLCAAI